MAPERTTRINRPEEEPENQHPETGPEGTSEIEEPRSTGFGGDSDNWWLNRERVHRIPTSNASNSNRIEPRAF
jgi:hypothetical protein